MIALGKVVRTVEGVNIRPRTCAADDCTIRARSWSDHGISVRAAMWKNAAFGS